MSGTRVANASLMTVTRATTVLKGEDFGIWPRKGVLSNDLIASVLAIANSKKKRRKSAVATTSVPTIPSA